MAQGCAWVSGIEFEYTHDLRRLIAEVTAVVGEFPFDSTQVIALTEHAVPLRYDEILDTEPIDRQATLALVDDVGHWAVAQLPTSSEYFGLNQRHLGHGVRETWSRNRSPASADPAGSLAQHRGDRWAVAGLCRADDLEPVPFVEPDRSWVRGLEESWEPSGVDGPETVFE